MLSRRRFLANSVLTLSALSMQRLALGDAGSQFVEVQTSLGRLRGVESQGFRAFRGIPFAQPPLGNLRFCPPRPALAWNGVREALAFAPAAMQPGQRFPQSEDCLYLNVTAPSGKGPFPVFVWIHGGGFVAGRACDPDANGAHFAINGIVCVNIAYRLGALGFLDVSPMLGEQYAGSANNAMRDIIAALEWVQQNISAFGGDPDRVTVGGQSAGAKLTCLLMGVPAARGLFHQMISESGGAERIWAQPRSEEIALDFGRVWQDSAHSSLQSLLTAPAADLIAAQVSFYRSPPTHFPLRCEVDGKLFPRFPLEEIRDGSTRGKRLLIGTNRDESAFFIGPHPDRDPGPSQLGNLDVKQFDNVAARYQQLYPDSSAEFRRIRATTAEEYWVPSLRVADAHLAGGGTEFVYRFDDADKQGRFYGLVPHAHELPFVWDNADALSPQDQKLAQTIHALWVDFIQGRPMPVAGDAQWPAYNLKERPTVILNLSPALEDNPANREYHLWDGLMMK